MSLIRWRRPVTLPTVMDEMDRMFDRYFRGPVLGAPQGEPYDFGPAIDVYETDTELVVKAELPGVTKDDIDLTLEDDRLLLKGESRHEEEVDEEGYHRRELRCGTFRRLIALPAAVDQDAIQATFADGILTVRAPKIAEMCVGKKVKIE